MVFQPDYGMSRSGGSPCGRYTSGKRERSQCAEARSAERGVVPRPDRLSLDMLETLIAVVDCEGDAIRAAEILGINQPSMSKRLAVLQHSNPQARRPWLERRGKTWFLTEEGKRNVAAVRQIVRLARTLQTDLDERFALAPDVSLACGQLALLTFVRQALLEFRGQNPDARLRVSTPRGRERILGVANGELDLAVVAYRDDEVYRVANRPLIIEPLFEDPWILVCGLRAPDAIRQAFEELPDSGVRLERLAGLPLILPEPDAGLRREIDQALLETGLHDQLNSVMEIGAWPALLSYVRDGFGIGLIGASALAERADGLLPPKSVATRPSDVPLVQLICRHTAGDSEAKDLSPSGIQLWELIRKAVRAQSTGPGE